MNPTLTFRLLLLVCFVAVCCAGVGAQSVTLSSPYVEDFESGPGGWSASSLWELGTPAQAHLNSAHSGTQAWMTNLTGNYPNNANALLTGPTFDFSGLRGDPIMTIAINHRTERVWDGCQVEIDRGNGWRDLGTNGTWYNTRYVVALDGPGWSNGSNGWTIVTHKLVGTAGLRHVGIRIRFASDSSQVDEGVAIDDIRVEAQNFSVSPTQSYFENFDSGNGHWSGSGLWERSAPTQAQLGPANSGNEAWVTDRDGNYPPQADMSVTSDLFDFSGCPNDPMLSMAVNYAIHPGAFGVLPDGFRIEVNRYDGAGFVPLGSITTWYPMANVGLMGGPGFTGSSGGWIVINHPITGTAGLTDVQLRVRFGSDFTMEGEGVAFDDVSISCIPEDWKGTDALAGDDLQQRVTIDGRPRSGFVHDVAVGQVLDLRLVSPKQNLNGEMCILMGESFATGATPTFPGNGTGLSHLPGVTFGIIGTLNDPSSWVPLPAQGLGFAVHYTGGFAGQSVILQAASLSALAQNGGYATTTDLELRFQ